MESIHRRNVLKGIGAGTLLVIASDPATAGDRGGGDDGGKAQVRVGHLSPDTPEVDVYVGRGRVDTTATDPSIAGLGYQTFAPNATGEYLSLRPGRYTVKVTPAGDPETVAIEAAPVLQPKTGYTILAVGELSSEDSTFSGNDEAGLQPLPLVDFDGRDDDDEDEDDDTARARFIHASPDAETVDIIVKDGPTIASGLDFGEATGYHSLDPAEYTIQVTKGDVVALEVTVDLEAGDKVSAYVVGNAITDESDDDVEDGTGAGGAVGRLNALLTVDGKAQSDSDDEEGNGEDD